MKIFSCKKCDIFSYLLLNIYIVVHVRTASEAVKTSTHNLGFRAKIRDDVYPCKPQFYYIRMGCEGVQITQVCYHDRQHDICVDISKSYIIYSQC